MLHITTTLEQNQSADRLNIPYHAHVECSQIINRGPHFQIPVRASFTGMKKLFSVEVSGFRLTTEQINNIPTLVERLIEGVTRLGRLPHYVFIARDAGIVYPVYTVDDEVLAPTPYGPLFQHVELAVMRERLSDYLHEIKVLGAKGRTDKLHVRGVDRHTLQLVRPIFYLKKRDEETADFWAPVFKSKEGHHIYTYAASNRREAIIDDGKEVLTLHNLVASVLESDKRLSNPHDLRPDRLFSDRWEQLKASALTELETPLSVNGIDVPVYDAYNGMTVGLEVRPNENRYSLFLGDDVEDVRSRAERDFARRGIGV